MSGAPKTDVWYPFFVGDYRKDTARLSCEQHGAYRQLLDEYWITGPLPDDDQILARLVGLEVRVWRKHRPHIQRFFVVADGIWRHGRVDRELVAAADRKTKAGAKAKAAAAARWGRSDASNGHGTSNATSMLQALPEDVHEECPPPSPSPAEVVPFPEPSEKTKPQQSDKAARRGSRIPDQWGGDKPGEAIVFAIREGLNDADAFRILEDFCDFWRAKSGADAVKLDWMATWRRWVREELRRRAQRPSAARPQKRVSFV